MIEIEGVSYESKGWNKYYKCKQAIWKYVIFPEPQDDEYNGKVYNDKQINKPYRCFTYHGW